MALNLFQVLSPLIALMANVVIQISSVRIFSRLGVLKSVILGFASGLFSLFVFGVVCAFFCERAFVITIVVDSIIYLPLGYGYFHFVNLGETARRIRILREIYDSGRGLSMDEILERYNADMVVKVRLERLLNNGQILDKNDRYYIGKPTMLIITKGLAMIKKIIFGKREFV
ncbi:MAG: hypothetical protein GY797_17640 [Deltaproteobacteria bacterium]|nr:hypothetical protein [Deltaproteobacteria bacterium]